MGKEDLGFLATNASIYKTIDSNYIVQPNNGYFLMQILETNNFQNNELITRSTILFQDLFNNFICTENNLLSLDDINLKIYIMDGLISSMKHTLFQNSQYFTNIIIETFYTTSYSLYSNLKFLKESIEFNQQSFNSSDFSLIQTYQNDFRDFFLNQFFPLFSNTILQNNDLYDELNKIDNIHTLIYPSINKCKKMNLVSFFHKKKTPFFDHVDYQSHFFDDLQYRKEQSKENIYLYFFLNMKKLVNNNNNFNYTHNILAFEDENYEDFQVNSKKSIYHIKYDARNLRSRDVKNIFIYSYYINNRKKILVGFAFSDNNDYINSFNKYLVKNNTNTNT